MSPEQIEGRRVDHRSDIYSLGVTAYHMLAGVPPFRGDNALSVAVQHVKAQPERLENLVPDLPPSLCRAACASPATRPPSWTRPSICPRSTLPPPSPTR